MTMTRITGGDRDQRASHGNTRDTARDTTAQARSFEAALARRDTSKPTSPSTPPSTRPSPLSGGLLSARQQVREEGRRDKADKPPGAGRADQSRQAYRGDRADRHDHTDPADAFQAIADDGEGDVEDQDRVAARRAADGDGRCDIEEGRGTQDDAGPSAADEDGAEDAEGTEGTNNASGTASASRDAALPANTRRSADGDNASGGDNGGDGEGHGDRDGMARHTQAALLAALTSSGPKSHGGPAAAGAFVDARQAPHADAARHGTQGDAEKAALRGMLDAIDALRVDIDGRGGVEMDVSVAGTQGVTVRVEEQDGCLQTTVSCRYADDAMRLRPGVEKLASHLAARFARAARVRIETAPGADNRAPADMARGMTAHAGTEAHSVVAEAYAPAPSGEPV